MGEPLANYRRVIDAVHRICDQGVTCTVRDTRGREIAAACGQLAAES